jgi:N-acetylated-alpha-linked acidic dipeptidase
VIWALVALGIFQLIFLPRTSLSRDYRRLHFGIVGRDEIERLYLRSFSPIQDHSDGEREVGRSELGEFVRQCYDRSYTFGDDEKGDELKDYMVEKLKEFGHDVKVKRYWSSVPKHVNNSLSLLEEDGKELSFDLTDGGSGEGKSSYHTYSASGDVTSDVVYVNYGKIEDYDRLSQEGVPISDKIHLIRVSDDIEYPFQLADRHGAKGIILFNHPDDDVTADGVQPRDPNSIENRSVKYSNSWPGDPTSSDHACTRSYWCQRDSDIKGKIPTIPSLSISYSSAKEILKHLTKGPAFDNADGSSFHSGPSDDIKLHLQNHNINSTEALDNIFFEIPGLLDQTIIIGAPRDSLTAHSGHKDKSIAHGGATDASANALLLSLSEHIGHLSKKGWRPLRTIMIVSWDGSKPGSLGSSEFGKDQAAKLSKKVVAYVDLKGVSGTRFDVKANPLLSEYLLKGSKKVDVGDYDNDEETLFDYWKRQDNGLDIGLLGGGDSEGGKDYSWFQYILGIPSGSIGFIHDKVDGVHYENSRFDTIENLESVDPGFKLHEIIVKYIGILMLQLSEHETIEFNTSHYFDVINSQFEHLTKGLDSSLIQTIKTKLKLFEYRTAQFDVKNQELQDQMSIDYPWFKLHKKIKLAFLIKIMGSVAKRLDPIFLHESGLSEERPLLKHTIWAPNKFDGSQGDVLPGLQDSIRAGNSSEVAYWLELLDKQLQLANKHLVV